MTLARRMWLASAALALLVGAAFTALILAVSAQREATDREARSKDVTAASLQLERLVSDVESSFLSFTITGKDGTLETYRTAMDRLPAQLRVVAGLVSDDPIQSRRALGDREPDPRVRVRLRPKADPDPESDTGDQPRRRHIAQNGKLQTDEIRRLFGVFRADENKLAAQAARDADERTDVAVLVGAIAVGASMALIVLFGIVLARSIGRPVRAVAGGAGRIAGGELSLRLPEEGPGEVGELTRAFNEMAERLEVNHAELEQQNEELRESERGKTELVSIVSHELRTPLASVLGFTALLLKREFDPPTRRHYLGIVDAQARRLAALLEDFLDVQRIEHEGVDLEKEKVDLASLLDEQAQLYAAQSPKHRLAVELAERPLTVRGDPGRLAQVVGNLLSNAIKYSPDGRHRPAGRRPQRRRRPGRRARRGARDPGGSAEPHLHEVLPRRRRRHGHHRHRPRTRSLARDRRGSRRHDRF